MFSRQTCHFLGLALLAQGKSVTARALSQYFASEGALDVHPRDRPTRHLRHEGDRRDEARGALRLRRDSGQRHRHSDHRARDGHPRRWSTSGCSTCSGCGCPRWNRDLGKITRYRTGSRAQVEADFPHAWPLLTRKLNTDLIAEHYDDLLRLAGSLKFGHATASAPPLELTLSVVMWPSKIKPDGVGTGTVCSFEG